MSVASKNLFALLGNDEEEPVKAPVKTVDKTTMRTHKRGAEPEAPSKPATAGARRGPGGNEGAFRDRNAGSGANQRRPTDEATRGGGARGGRGARERGGPGGRFPRNRDDRHSKSTPTGGDKAAAQSLGAEGDAEAKDEQAGEELAQKELKEATAEDAEGLENPAEPENKSVSYAEYLAQQAEKKLALGDNLEIRQANEGSKTDKKWANAKALDKEDGEDFIAASGGKAQRQRERKQKNIVDIDQAWIESERPSGGAPRGGRGGARGDGAPRRGDGARGGRGRGEGRGRGGNAGGAPRGGRGGAAGFNANDQSAFPSLGGKN